jgi:single-strand DNA-binding protein
MARGLNKVTLIGNLGKDPELKYTNSGVAVATFSLATSDSWKDQEGVMQERTEWHNIVAWRKLAEICGQYLKKGSQVYIEGKIQTRNYLDKEGVKKYITEIVADQLLMLGGGGGKSQAEQPEGIPMPEPAPSKDDADLPF